MENSLSIFSRVVFQKSVFVYTLQNIVCVCVSLCSMCMCTSATCVCAGVCVHGCVSYNNAR